jgi:CheY-like chemotaxis protein
MPRPSSPRPKPLPEPAHSTDYPACRALYIEDDATNVEVMRGMLAHRPQIALTRRTGLEGIDLATRQPPQLILLDIDLPDIDGLEVLRRLKSDARVSHLPVVVVSSHAMGHEVQAALARGAADFLPKPLDLAALLLAIDIQLASNHHRLGAVAS